MNVLDVGAIAPDASFDVADGKRAKISDWRGKKLVVYFYPKDDTPGCTREAQGFSALAAEFEEAGAAVIGISKDSVKSHARFSSKYALALTLGSDSNGTVCDAFGVWVEKAMYGRTYMGIERTTFHVDAAGKIVKVWRKVKVPGHAESVLESVRAID